jgi:hypothetical protein
MRRRFFDLLRAFVRRLPPALAMLALALFPALAAAATDGADRQTNTANAASDDADEAKPLAQRPWVRVVQDDDRVIKLQVAVRTFERTEGDGPTLTIAGAVHVGDRPYYQELQQLLDEQHLVLYEGVRPAGAEQTPPRTTEEAVQRTKDRLRMVGAFVAKAHAHAEEHGNKPPFSIDELRAYLEEHGLNRARNWLGYLTDDGWGEPLVVVARSKTEGDGFDVISYGADGEPGGDGADADLRFSDQPPLSREERGEAPGVQARLAEVLRLTFQLDEMDESGERWRNADMSMSEVRDRIRQLGGDPDVLFGQLQGSGLTGRMVGFLLTMIDVLPGAPPRVKLMMIEMLQHADQLLASDQSPLGREVLQVIIEERNQVLMDKLLPVVNEEADERGWDSVGIIYGAGHMADLVDRLDVQADYEPVGGRWVTAISLDMNRAGISPMEHVMLKRQLESQLRLMR